MSNSENIFKSFAWKTLGRGVIWYSLNVVNKMTLSLIPVWRTPQALSVLFHLRSFLIITCPFQSTFSSNYSIFYYKISREKFEPEPGFETRTSRFLSRPFTTWAILVLMPAHVQISLLRRMPLLPGGGHISTCVDQKPIPCQREQKMYLNLCWTNPFQARHKMPLNFVDQTNPMPGQKMYFNLCWSNPNYARKYIKCISTCVHQTLICLREHKMYLNSCWGLKYISTCVDQTPPMPSRTQNA